MTKSDRGSSGHNVPGRVSPIRSADLHLGIRQFMATYHPTTIHHPRSFGGTTH
jgi:hypothetical protein